MEQEPPRRGLIDSQWGGYGRDDVEEAAAPPNSVRMGVEA